MITVQLTSAQLATLEKYDKLYPGVPIGMELYDILNCVVYPREVDELALTVEVDLSSALMGKLKGTRIKPTTPLIEEFEQVIRTLQETIANVIANSVNDLLSAVYDDEEE